MAKKNIFEPGSDHVLVADLAASTSIDGIEMPDNQRQKDMIAGVVIEKGWAVSNRVIVGQRVYYGPYAGKPIVLMGQELRLLREGQIELFVREIEVPDPLPSRIVPGDQE